MEKTKSSFGSIASTYGFGVAFTFILSDTNYKSDMRKCKCYNDDGAPKKSSASKDADKVSGNSSDKSADKSDQEKKPEEKKEEPKQETKEETKEEKTSETEASTKEEKSADEKVKEAAEKITAESAEADKEKAEKKPLMEIPQPELIKQDKVIPDFTFSNEDIVANISSIAPKMNTDPHNVEMITVLLLKIMNIITLEQMYHHLQKQDLEVVNSIYKFYTGSVLIPSVNTFGIEEACSLDFLIDMVNREQNYIMDIGNLSKENIDILERIVNITRKACIDAQQRNLKDGEEAKSNVMFNNATLSRPFTINPIVFQMNQQQQNQQQGQQAQWQWQPMPAYRNNQEWIRQQMEWNIHQQQTPPINIIRASADAHHIKVKTSKSKSEEKVDFDPRSYNRGIVRDTRMPAKNTTK